MKLAFQQLAEANGLLPSKHYWPQPLRLVATPVPDSSHPSDLKNKSLKMASTQSNQNDSNEKVSQLLAVLPCSLPGYAAHLKMHGSVCPAPDFPPSPQTFHCDDVRVFCFFFHFSDQFGFN